MPLRSHTTPYRVQLERCVERREDHHHYDCIQRRFPMVIAMLNDGRLKAEPLITRIFSLQEALGTILHFEELGKGNIKMLIEMN